MMVGYYWFLCLIRKVLYEFSNDTGIRGYRKELEDKLCLIDQCGVQIKHNK